MSSKQLTRLSSKAEHESNVEKARTKKAVKNIGGVTKELSKAMQSMDLEKVEKIMSKFESQFEDLDVRTGTIENSMHSAFSLSAPEQDVTNLMKQIADENGLEIASMIADAPSVGGSLSVGGESSRTVEDENLSQRLAELRQ